MQLSWLVAVALVSACGAPAASNAPPRSSPADVTTALTALIPQLMEAGDVPGLAIGLLRDDQLIWQHGFGVADAGTRRPVTRETVFQTASLCKPVFAYAVLKLVEAGELDLDRPLTSYLPGSYEVGPDPRLGGLADASGAPHRPCGMAIWLASAGGP